MANFTCVECHQQRALYQHYDADLCIQCAKETGQFERYDASEEMYRIEQEAARAKREAMLAAQEEFNAAQEAKRELADRELCRRHLLPFIKRNSPGYMPGWVHADICQRLEKFAQAIENGESPRLMITMPPRHGKSEIGSKTFPTWFMGRNPTFETIVTSYSGDLAKDFSRKCRDLMDSDAFKNVFKTRLSKTSKSVEKWATEQGGGFTAAGVQGPITGRGGHLAIVDDPVKDREEAESPTTRQKIKDWYSSTFYTRLAPGGGILIIQTRWHDDDLSGWLLTEMQEAEREMQETGEWPEDADRWELVEYPAIATQDETYRKAGEALHPDRFPLKALRRIKRAMIPRDWEALYQQRPVSEDGDYFTKGMFRYYKAGEAPPIADMRVYAAGDLAISTKQTADYTVFVVVGIDRQQNIWLLDLHRGQWNSLGIIDKLFHIQTMYNPELFGIEAGQIELTLEPFIQKAEEERGIALSYEKLKTRGADKGTRARPIQGRMEQGKVYFPTVESTPWMQSLQNEMLKFPLGANDDQVDALAWIGQMIMLFGIVNQKKEASKESEMQKRLKALMRKNRSGKAMGA